jgi:hypothetical protein
MHTFDTQFDWNSTTWEGSRAAKLRQWRRLSLRQRFEALEEMSLLSQRLAEMRQRSKAVDARSSRA